MAKRAPQDEQPYRPLLDPGVVAAAITKIATPQTAQTTGQPPTAKTVDLPRSEIGRPQPKNTSAEPLRLRARVEEGRGAPQELAEKFDQEKRILLTRAEAAALDRLVISLASRLGAQVKLSHLLRGLISLTLNAEAHVDKRAGEAGTLIRPPNGDAKALQRFEREIAGILSAAIRDAGPLR